MACVSTGLFLSREQAAWSTLANFHGFFDNGPYGVEPWPQAHNWYGVWRNPVTGEESLADAIAGYADGRIPADFWNPAGCFPTEAGLFFSRAIRADATPPGAVVSPSPILQFIYGAREKVSKGLIATADAIDKNVPTPKETLNATAEALGDAIGRLLAAFTIASARGTGAGISAFWEELPPAGKVAVLAGGAVTLYVAVKAIQRAVK